ncbi:oligopeptide/dipeptide ABC transporter ATP-binding protein [Nonomuraea rhizosphaerae]|uniref:oligopeptide/dipeptide ABC transporter ATP-binding protein n=1 Tax=Nonomuraea rhizosphaerae TaxID=2665663 RepID=UPI001C5F2AF0|nr:oligopeptide/dipeptide ABC transporter ATP-binding protein [Nonomuraea rhizosphaerae]
MYVTHDLAVVAELAHRVAVMYAGQIVEIGPKDEVFAAPSHPYTRALLAAIPSVTEERALTGIPGRAPAPGARPSGCRFHDRCALALADCARAEPPMTDLGNGLRSRCLRAEHVRERPLPAAVAAPAPPTAAETVLDVRGLRARHGGAGRRARPSSTSSRIRTCR